MTHVVARLSDWTDLTDDEGLLDRPVPPSELWVPADIEVVGDRLVWGNRDKDPWVEAMWIDYKRRCAPSDDALTQFVKLADADGAAILQFAKQNGTLQLCRHRFPSGRYQSRTHPQERGKYWCRPLAEKRPARPRRFYEPLESWLIYARIARSILNVAANLLEDRRGSAEDWTGVLELLDPGTLPRLRTDPNRLGLEAQRSHLAIAVNIWNAGAGLRLAVRSMERWGTAGYPELRLTSGTLFGELGLRLAMAVCGTRGLATCSACGAPYTPKRAPTPGKRNYCPKCGRSEAVKFASRKYRRKKEEHHHGEEARKP